MAVIFRLVANQPLISSIAGGLMLTLADDVDWLDAIQCLSSSRLVFRGLSGR